MSQRGGGLFQGGGGCLAGVEVGADVGGDCGADDGGEGVG